MIYIAARAPYAAMATPKQPAFGCEGCAPSSTPVAALSKVLKVATDNFDQDVLQSKTPVLVDFYADWCPPCQNLAPILEDLAAIHHNGWPKGTRIAKVDVEASRDLMQRYNVKSMPTLVLFNQGKEITRWTGASDKTTLIERVSKALPTLETV